MTRLAPLAVLLAFAPTSPAGYDPLDVPKGTPDQQDFVVTDDARSRDIPVRVFFPKEKTPAPVVLFSHGLGGTRELNAFMGNHWAGRGYVAVFLQHPGSDDAVWKDKNGLGKKAASPENLLLRVKDVPAVLDQLERWNKDTAHPLGGRIDPKRVGMSGHSFGAITTQAVSGQTAAFGKGFAEPRIKAAVVMSPSIPERGDPKKAFADVKLPWLLMTGTKDVSPIRHLNDLQTRLSVYPNLPAGGKYEVVFENAEHSAFTDRRLPGDKEKRNPNHHRAMLALTTAFWDAYLRDDAAAKKWLDGDAARAVLEKDDRWQKK